MAHLIAAVGTAALAICWAAGAIFAGAALAIPADGAISGRVAGPGRAGAAISSTEGAVLANSAVAIPADWTEARRGVAAIIDARLAIGRTD